jgi:hypothetical protein
VRGRRPVALFRRVVYLDSLARSSGQTPDPASTATVVELNTRHIAHSIALSYIRLASPRYKHVAFRFRFDIGVEAYVVDSIIVVIVVAVRAFRIKHIFVFVPGRSVGLPPRFDAPFLVST